MLDVLLLLAVARRLLQGSDDQRRSSRDDRDSSLTVLDRKLDSYAQAFLLQASVHLRCRARKKRTTYPVASGLSNVFTDLLGRQTQRTDLRSESRRSTDLTTSGAEVATK